MKKVVALSLFNGVGGAMMACDELNIPTKMYSSEIDKYANKAAQALFPDTIQLGDITKWDVWEDEHNFSLGDVDILFAGFPCQAWSMAGKQQGDSDPRGELVHVLLEIYGYIKILNPNVKFMFENVAMKKEFLDYINDLFGVAPVKINSALLTAQNRKRNYWANWEITQPEDKGILLRDILENGCVDKNKSYCVDANYANYAKGGNPQQYFNKSRRQLVFNDKEAIESLRPCKMRDSTGAGICHHVATATDIRANESNKRVYADTGKSPTVTTMGGGHREPKVLVSDAKYRKLTPRECMRLQGFPEWVIEKLLNSGISNSQLYKIIGNGFTHSVIVHNLQCLINSGWSKAVNNG